MPFSVILTPTEERLIKAAQQLGPNTDLARLAQAAGMPAHYARGVKLRLISLGFWPKAAPMNEGGPSG